jgi:hypothetical protein
MLGGNPKLFKLDNILISTSYGVKNEVRKACEELLRNYDALDCYNIPNPIIGAPPTRVIEIFGTVPVNFKGNVYHMMMSFIFPPLFPNVPPLVHFANPDAKKYMALQKYDSKKFIAPNGKYYYPLTFSEVQNWMTHRSVMRIVAQVVKEFSNEYPIYAGSTGPSNTNTSTHLFKPNNPFPNNNNVNNPNGMFGQQGFNPQNANTMLASNIGNFNKPNVNVGMGMGGGNQKDQVLAPLKTRYKEEALQIAKKLEKDLNVQRNNMVELQNTYLKLQEEQEKLQKFELSVPQITGDLETKIQGLDQIISTHAGTVLSIQTLPTAIEEEDEASKILLDLMTTNKAIEDLNLFIEDLFNAGKLDLESYLKVYKDNTEREFLNNVIMKKLITEQQQQF